jgi:TonB family protein
MATLNNDIERYLRGELSPAEMHDLEKKALLDPFLAEALEGAEHVSATNFSADLGFIQESITEKARHKRARIISINKWSWYSGIAAALLLLTVSYFVILLLIEQQKNTELSSSKELKNVIPQQQQLSVADTLNQDENTAQAIVEEEMSLPQRTIAAVGSNTSPIHPVETTRTQSEIVTQSPVIELATNTSVRSSNERIVAANLYEPPLIMQIDTLQERESLAKVRLPLVPENSIIIRGRVTDEDGSPIPGVTVKVVDAEVLTSTDMDGNYQINLAELKQKLAFSFIGYSTKEIPVTNNKEVNAQLHPDIASLSEVVVVGRGQQHVDNTTALQPAEPLGGQSAYQKYLEQKLLYPKQAIDNKVEGKVTIQFTVEPNGELSNFHVVKGLGYGCDDEVIRLVKQGPAWTPTKRNRAPIKDKVRVKLKFKLPEKK